MIALAQQPNQQKSNEWYTPHRYVEAARLVMGSIDLDPASCELANQTVKAARYYTKEDDGLRQSWHGRVWLNPPYGNGAKQEKTVGAMRAWTSKLIHHYKTGDIEQAVLLCTLEIGAKWFNALLAYPICLPDHKLMFTSLLPNENRWSGKFSHFHGSIFVYLGKNEQKFIEVFSTFGDVFKRVSVPKPKHTTLRLWGD